MFQMIATAATAVAMSAASFAGCQPPDAGPGIPIVERPAPAAAPAAKPAPAVGGCYVHVSELNLEGLSNPHGCQVNVAMDMTVTFPTPENRCIRLEGRYLDGLRPLCKDVAR